MSRELDARGRRAGDRLRMAIAAAELNSVAPGTHVTRTAVTAILRPIWVAAFLLAGTAVGVALVFDSGPSPDPIPPAPSTTVATTTTIASTTTEATTPPTSAAAVPLIPPTTVAPADLEAPHLEITAPHEGAELGEKTVTFAGVTEPGARVFAGPYEADVSASGEWHIFLILNEGSNVARFVARDAAGNESTASVTVHYVVATTTTTKPETPTTQKELAAFSAHATFGSCSETPPYDVYYGTGQPGTRVDIVSEYGSASVEVGPDGHWEKKVVFETAPPGEYFLVKAKDQFGRRVEFEFIYQP